MTTSTDTRVSTYIRQIIKAVGVMSGYPYPDDTRIHANQAFAFGLALGTLSALAKEWEDRETKP